MSSNDSGEDGKVTLTRGLKNENKQIAVFGGGCFWCTEAIFKRLIGVVSVVPGYAGGFNLDWENKSDLDHAEVVKIEFDAGVITYLDLLKVFFCLCDPTEANFLDKDFKEQYRSIILYTSPEQKEEAEEYIEVMENKKKFDYEIVTEIKPLVGFISAKNDDFNYYEKNKNKLYCRLVIEPRIKKLKRDFPYFLRSGID